MNCPFYGRAYYQVRGMLADPPFLLFDQQGNQCALVVTSHAPCRMEMEQLPVDWRECPLVASARMERP